MEINGIITLGLGIQVQNANSYTYFKLSISKCKVCLTPETPVGEGK